MPNPELRLIEEAAASGTTILDLSRLGLTSLPPAIGRLTNLQELDLRQNALTELPPEIGQLESLQRLYLLSNALTSLPPEMGQLENLQVLNLRGNPLPSDFPFTLADSPEEIAAVMEYVREHWGEP